MYCGACMRDTALVHEMVAREQDVLMLPLYTPLKRDDDFQLPESRIFYGGINVYLQQISLFFQHMPIYVDRIFDHPALLKLASQFAVQTNPSELGPMTVSMLAGRDGKQWKELHKLIVYLKRQLQPEIVVITNSLLSAIAPEVRATLGVPVVCMLQGEESFLRRVPEPHRELSVRLLRKNATAIDLFIAPHAAYAAQMAAYLAAPAEKFKVIHAGIDTRTYRYFRKNERGPFRVAYLSSITPKKGQDILLEAFRILVNEQGRHITLSLAGKVLNNAYWESLQRRIKEEQLEARVEFHGELDQEEKIAFLRRATVFAMPTRVAETRAMAAMEAMAIGLPLLAPSIGVFPELLGLTHGGLLLPPQDDPEALAQAIARMIDNPHGVELVGQAAADGIATHFTAANSAEQTIEVLATLHATQETAPKPRVSLRQ